MVDSHSAYSDVTQHWLNGLSYRFSDITSNEPFKKLERIGVAIKRVDGQITKVAVFNDETHAYLLLPPTVFSSIRTGYTNFVHLEGHIPPDAGVDLCFAHALDGEQPTMKVVLGRNCVSIEVQEVRSDGISHLVIPSTQIKEFLELVTQRSIQEWTVPPSDLEIGSLIPRTHLLKPVVHIGGIAALNNFERVDGLPLALGQTLLNRDLRTTDAGNYPVIDVISMIPSDDIAYATNSAIDQTIVLNFPHGAGDGRPGLIEATLRNWPGR